MEIVASPIGAVRIRWSVCALSGKTNGTTDHLFTGLEGQPRPENKVL